MHSNLFAKTKTEFCRRKAYVASVKITFIIACLKKLGIELLKLRKFHSISDLDEQ